MTSTYPSAVMCIIPLPSFSSSFWRFYCFRNSASTLVEVLSRWPNSAPLYSTHALGSCANPVPRSFSSSCVHSGPTLPQHPSLPFRPWPSHCPLALRPELIPPPCFVLGLPVSRRFLAIPSPSMTSVGRPGGRAWHASPLLSVPSAPAHPSVPLHCEHQSGERLSWRRNRWGSGGSGWLRRRLHAC